MYNMAIESFKRLETDRKADYLLNYQYLLKESGVCHTRTFKDCLQESTIPCVAPVDRCEPIFGICDGRER